MNQALWRILKPAVAEIPCTDQPAAPPAIPEVVAAHDRVYVQAHPELYAIDTHKFYYDRDPLPTEWPEDLPSGCYVRVFVINEWTIVRALHAPNGKRLQAPVMNTWSNAI